MNNTPSDLIKAMYAAQEAEEKALNELSTWLSYNFNNRLAVTFQNRAEALRSKYRSAVYDVIELTREAEDIKAYYKRLGANE